MKSSRGNFQIGLLGQYATKICFVIMFVFLPRNDK